MQYCFFRHAPGEMRIICTSLHAYTRTHTLTLTTQKTFIHTHICIHTHQTHAHARAHTHHTPTTHHTLTHILGHTRPWSHRSAPQTEYHPDTQYTSVLLWCHITSLLWRQKGVTFTERRALLFILSQYVKSLKVRTMHAHMREGPLADLVQKLETKKFTKKQTHDSCIGE